MLTLLLNNASSVGSIVAADGFKIDDILKKGGLAAIRGTLREREGGVGTHLFAIFAN